MTHFITNGELSEVDPFEPSFRKMPVRFPVGDVTVTPAARPFVRPIDRMACIILHERGVWGAVDECDAIRNEECIRRQANVVSLYWTRAGASIYVVTNLKSGRTVIMRAEEYYPSDAWSVG